METSGSAFSRSTQPPVAMSKLYQVVIDGIRNILVRTGAGVSSCARPFLLQRHLETGKTYNQMKALKT